MEPAARREVPPLLNVFCLKEGDAWRLHLAPESFRPSLERLFDHNGEAYPVLVDWEHLDRHMAARNAPYDAHMSHAGSVELTARGACAADALAEWLAMSLSSGIRLSHEHEREREHDDSKPATG
jgi:hypothetical protein